MNIISKLPGPLLVFFGALSLSFGGLIVKSFQGANLWQILFWRSIFFILVVSIFLILTYRKKVFTAFSCGVRSPFPPTSFCEFEPTSQNEVTGVTI